MSAPTSSTTSSGRWAVITGASAGLGADFARQLAARGWNLVLVARRADRLRALADELRNAHRTIEVEVVPLDLQREDAAQVLLERATDRGRHIHALLNNAGFGLYGPFEEVPWEQTLGMMTLNMTRLTELTWVFVRHMREHGEPAHVLNVGSVAALQPVPYFSAYGATKAYVRNFSEGLAYELKGTNVHVTLLAPGATRTEFSDVAGIAIPKLADNAQMASDVVVRQALDAMLAGRASVVPGLVNWGNALSARLFPRQFLAAMAVRLMGGRSTMRAQFKNDK